MKKIFAVFFVSIMLLALSACSMGQKPDKAVAAFCESLKAFDPGAASAYVVDGEIDLDDSFSEETEGDALNSEQFLEYLKQNASQMTYVIGTASVDGDHATVPVTFTYVDASGVMEETLADYIAQAISLAFSGASDEEIEALMVDIFADKSASVETRTETVDVVFPCEKVDGTWKISKMDSETEDALLQILTCNIIAVFEDMGSDFSTDGQNSEEDAVWYDIPVGQELELATLKIRITGCQEFTELTADYFEPAVAQEGTKFVVYTVEIENTTKDTMGFSNDLLLEDSQGRTYKFYSDAAWYFDEAFVYTELAPNIKVTGNFVYNIPTDSVDYFLRVGKAGTNEMYRLYGA